MVDSYLHPKAVSFINYFYDYIRKEDPEIKMNIELITPEILKHDVKLAITIYVKKETYNYVRYNYLMESLIYADLKPEIEAKCMLKELQKRCDQYGKIET